MKVSPIMAMSMLNMITVTITDALKNSKLVQMAYGYSISMSPYSP